MVHLFLLLLIPFIAFLRNFSPEIKGKNNGFFPQNEKRERKENENCGKKMRKGERGVRMLFLSAL